jgi:PAS domain S-box-containing protein
MISSGDSASPEPAGLVHLLATIMEAVPDPIFAKDLAGRYVLVNGACARSFGLAPLEIVGRTDGDLRPAASAARAREVERGVLERGTVETYDETEERDGRVRHWRVTTGVYTDSRGKPEGTFGVAVDVTDRVAREEAERARARLDGALLVARTVAHEINNALSPITGGADLLALDRVVADHPGRAAYLAMIMRAADDVAAKVRQLQSIVRLEEQPSGLGPGSSLLDMERSTGT